MLPAASDRPTARSLLSTAPRSTDFVEADRLGALPEHLLAQLRELLLPFDDRQKVVARELARLAREAGLAVREEDLGLADAAASEGLAGGFATFGASSVRNGLDG
jgi:hypothetical protein